MIPVYEEYVTLTFHVSVFVRFFYNFTNMVKKKRIVVAVEIQNFSYFQLLISIFATVSNWLQQNIFTGKAFDYNKLHYLRGCYFCVNCKLQTEV